MRASLATNTGIPSAASPPSGGLARAKDTAAVSRLPTGQTGMSSARPKPCAIAQATRRLVKAPGPASKATPARSAGRHPDSASTRVTSARMRAEWACPTVSSATTSSAGESPWRSATDAASPKTAMASTGPRGDSSGMLIGADCTEPTGSGDGRRGARRPLPGPARAAGLEGDGVLAQLLAQGAALVGGEASGGSAAAGYRRGLRSRARRGARGGDVLAQQVLAKQLGPEPDALGLAHAAHI